MTTSRRTSLLKDAFCIFFIFVLTCLLFMPAIKDDKVFIPSDLVYSMLPWAFYAKDHGLPTTFQNLPGPPGKPAEKAEMIKFHNTDPTDVIHHQYPYRLFYQRNILNNKVPLWNPHIFCGAPFNGNDQSSIFYPFQFLFYRFMDAPSAYTWLAFFQFFLSGLFMFALMRYEGAGRVGSCLSAILFMFNGCSIVWMPNTTFQSPGMWLPLILLLASISFRKKSITAALLCSVIIGTLLMAGLLQYASYSLFALLLYTGYHALLSIKDIPRSKYIVISGGLSIFIGIAISIAHVWPVKILSDMIYRVPRPPQGLHFDGLPTKFLKTIIFPDLYGNPIDMTYHEKIPYMATTFFVPAIALLLCGSALIMVFFRAIPPRKRVASAFYFLLMIFALAAMFGNPVYAFYYYFVPGAKTLKVSRIGYLFTFGASASAGFGLYAVKIFLSSIIYRFEKRNALPEPKPVPDETNINNSTVGEQEIHSHNNESVLSKENKFLKFLFKPYLLAPRFAEIILLIIVAYSLIPWAIKYTTFSERAYLYPDVDVTTYLKNIKDPDKWRIFSPDRPMIIFPNTAMVLELDDIRGYDSLNMSNYGSFLDSILKKGHSPAPRQAVTIAELPGLVSATQLNWLNVRYVITTKKFDMKQVPFYQKIDFNRGISVYKNNRALTLALFADTYAVIKDDAAIIDRITENSYMPNKVVFLSDALNFDQVNNLPKGNLIAPGQYLFKINKWESDYIELETSIPEKRVMFFSETYYPGWKASIDGVPVKVVRANAIFRAVPVPAGKHVLKMWFAPENMIYGFYISFAFLFLTGAVIIGFSVYGVIKKVKKTSGE